LERYRGDKKGKWPKKPPKTLQGQRGEGRLPVGDSYINPAEERWEFLVTFSISRERKKNFGLRKELTPMSGVRGEGKRAAMTTTLTYWEVF